MNRFLSSSIVWAVASSAGTVCLAAGPPVAPLRAAGEPAPPAAELPAFPDPPASPAAGEPSSPCRDDKGQIACATRNRSGLFLDVRPGPAEVSFQLDVYLSECNVSGVPYKTRHSVSQESRRAVWYRFNQATSVHWTWRPLNPCWQVWFVDCTAGGQKRNCNDVLTVRGILAR